MSLINSKNEHNINAPMELPFFYTPIHNSPSQNSLQPMLTQINNQVPNLNNINNQYFQQQKISHNSSAVQELLLKQQSSQNISNLNIQPLSLDKQQQLQQSLKPQSQHIKQQISNSKSKEDYSQNNQQNIKKEIESSGFWSQKENEKFMEGLKIYGEKGFFFIYFLLLFLKTLDQLLNILELVILCK